MKNSKEGFTLIELLVVVAIIGILASVVLASLNTARNKGTDAAIKGTLGNTRAQAALFYDDQNPQVYEGVCAPGVGIYPMLLSASEKLNPGAPSVGIDSDDFVYNSAGGVGATVCHDSDTAWAAIVSLKNPNLPVGGPYASGWCVDSTGASHESETLAADETVCP